jgi:hypothetical protein
LLDVRERPAAGLLGDLAVAEAGDEQREVFALALGELRQQPQRRARLERVERPAVGDHGIPTVERAELLKARVTAPRARQPARLVDRDRLQPREQLVLGGVTTTLRAALWSSRDKAGS